MKYCFIVCPGAVIITAIVNARIIYYSIPTRVESDYAQDNITKIIQ